MTEELQESELGTLQYWDERYKEEIVNFHDHGDVGEIWFGEDTVQRIIKWFRKNGILEDGIILDLGCGNGMFAIELASEGYKNLTGVDYSEDAVTLAKSIAEKENYCIDFRVCDILEGFEGCFDVVHDKGTYDAISLNANIKEYRGRYLENVCKILNDGGIFIITSCNWTKNELNEQFKDVFVQFSEIPAPQIQFGGKTGNTVTTIIYKKITN